MQIAEMNMEEIEARSLEIASELENATEERLAELKTEAEEIATRKAELEAIETRNAQAKEIEAGAPAKVVETQKEVKSMSFGIETKEYRDAFMAMLVGRETAEQRSIMADNSAYGDGVALPQAMDQAIWDQVHTEHPILADVTTINAGMPIKVTKATPGAITKKKDSDVSAEQNMTILDVVLVGADYHTYVTLSYAEAKMTQGAMEKFLVSEIASAIGEALAKDVFARILSDATVAQKVVGSDDMFADLKAALAKATLATAPVIYAPASSYFEIVGAIKSGSPFNMGAALGCPVKLDNAATKITIVDPKAFVLDVVQNTMIEAQRDAKNAHIVVGGYMRAEGCLRKVKAAAYID